MNQITGEIPKSFSQFPDIQGFNVFSNRLYGPLPSFRNRLPALSFFTNCYSDQDLQPVLRQFLSQGKTVNVTQRPPSECSAFLSQIPSQTETTTRMPSSSSTQPPNEPPAASPPNLALILGITFLLLSIIIITTTLFFFRRRRQRLHHNQSLKKGLALEPITPLPPTHNKLDKDSPIPTETIEPKQALFSTPSIFLHPEEVKDGNLFRNIAATAEEAPVADYKNQPGSSSGSGTHAKEADRVAPSSLDSPTMSNWTSTKVSESLTSAGVNLGFIEILKDHGVDGARLLQLDHERLEEMGIGPFDARVLLLIAIGMLKERHEGDGPPGYA
ncbi:hypothetical protein HDU97_004270 [Phlyctochytrium planicorne]|nr:hypothetical protein HDU97_004270 [Phlyctochytrium planicorne]